MASYRKLKNNKWEVTIDLGRDPLTGKRKRAYKSGFKTKKEAVAYANSFSVDVANGLNVIDSKVLLKDFINTWYNDYKSNTLSMNTKASYSSRINKFIIPYLGHIPISKITTANVQQFYNDLIKQGSKPNSAKKIIEVLRGCFKYAKKLNLVTFLPTDIETVPQEAEKVAVWDDNQLKYFLSEIKDTWLYVPIMIISLTGLRVGELCGLRWDNVDFENGIIHVCEQVTNDKMNKTLIHTDKLKTKTSYRDISIPNSLIHVLKEHKLSQPCNNHKGFVVLDRQNKMCNPRNVSMNFTNAVQKYKLSADDIHSSKKKYSTNYMQLPQISIHDLRHTHATILLLKGENIKVISERLGHNSVKITLDTYSHVLPSMQ
ncbi:site-specific integrase [Inconstantimicrobium porci]|uniref:Site-specific integrase n=1 Tax=Inconstantimicrobium porci TaxID=2652291 RepID=A0A7X2N042_9CLOT|nr:site-specific integrase [Inconstantimicrobium porci]MSR92276.1 site-specific integrase [Inconstantimicrobium porci]